MKKGRGGFKELNACISILRSLQARGALDPSQREKLKRAISVLRKPHRRGVRGHRELVAAVRVIAELLWEAFSKVS